jgi:hypothetical protein
MWTQRSGLAGVIDALRLLACAFGYFLSFIGWFCFLLQVLLLGNGVPNVGERLYDIGCVIVAGWVLLRFAAGLFPFGRHFFRHSGGLM